jgi:hypothetical protein
MRQACCGHPCYRARSSARSLKIINKYLEGKAGQGLRIVIGRKYLDEMLLQNSEIFGAHTKIAFEGTRVCSCSWLALYRRLWFLKLWYVSIPLLVGQPLFTGMGPK